MNVVADLFAPESARMLNSNHWALLYISGDRALAKKVWKKTWRISIPKVPLRNSWEICCRCAKKSQALTLYLFFEILWKTAIGKFLRDQNIMVQWFGSFNHGYLFVGILTLVQMWNMAFSTIYFIKIRAPKLTCCESKILLFEFMYSSANRTVTRLCNSFKPPSS